MEKQEHQASGQELHQIVGGRRLRPGQGPAATSGKLRPNRIDFGPQHVACSVSGDWEVCTGISGGEVRWSFWVPTR